MWWRLRFLRPDLALCLLLFFLDLDLSDFLLLEESDRAMLFAALGLACSGDGEAILAAARAAGSGGGPGGCCAWTLEISVGYGPLG